MEFLEKKSHMSNDYAVDSTGAVLFGFAQDNNNAGIDDSPPPVSTPPPLENWLQLYQKSIESSGATQEPTRPGVQRGGYDRITTRALAASLSVNGATAKVGKKRSRASRRAPTTLLSTDASNFRAMVQQFTGFPEPPFAPSQAAAPLLGRSFPHVALGSPLTSLSFAHRPQPYPSFPLQSLLIHEDINVRGPEFFPRYPSQGQPQPGSLLVNDLGVNPSAAAAAAGGLSSNIMLPSERRQGYLF